MKRQEQKVIDGKVSFPIQKRNGSILAFNLPEESIVDNISQDYEGVIWLSLSSSSSLRHQKSHTVILETNSGPFDDDMHKYGPFDFSKWPEGERYTGFIRFKEDIKFLEA